MADDYQYHDLDADVEQGGTGERGTHGLVLPLTRVRKLVKAEGDVKAVAAEASFLVARASELLLELLAERAAQHMLQEGRKTLQYKDVAASVAQGASQTLFLRDIVPPKVSAATLLAQAALSHR